MGACREGEVRDTCTVVLGAPDACCAAAWGVRAGVGMGDGEGEGAATGVRVGAGGEGSATLAEFVVEGTASGAGCMGCRGWLGRVCVCDSAGSAAAGNGCGVRGLASRAGAVGPPGEGHGCEQRATHITMKER